MNSVDEFVKACRGEVPAVELSRDEKAYLVAAREICHISGGDKWWMFRSGKLPFQLSVSDEMVAKVADSLEAKQLIKRESGSVFTSFTPKGWMVSGKLLRDQKRNEKAFGLLKFLGGTAFTVLLALATAWVGEDYWKSRREKHSPATAPTSQPNR